MDMSQFTEAFLEESFEGLEHMETELLALNAGDEETLHTIFRAAHSIKGGAGTFGFSAISEFTHGMETLLDRMRNGQQETTPEIVNLLLRAVDVLRGQLQAARDGGEADPAEAAEVRALIEATLGDDTPAPATGGGSDDADSGNADGGDDGTSGGWRIHFRPHADLLRTGNDPLRMFEVLEELGELTVHCDAEGLPATLEGYDPEASYLAWTLELRGDAERADVEEVFEWVEDECDLTIEPLETAGDSTEAHPPADPAPDGSGAESTPPGGEDGAGGAPARAASKPTESSSILQEINKAISQLDEVTQQNAALVEEAASSSESLDNQANELQELMAFFNSSHSEADAHQAREPAHKESARPARQSASAGRRKTPAPEKKPATTSRTQAGAKNDRNEEWEEF